MSKKKITKNPPGGRRSRKRPVNYKERQTRLTEIEQDRKLLPLIRGGATIAQVQEVLGVGSPTTAKKAIFETMARYAPPMNHVTHARNVMGEQYESMVRTAWNKATGVDADPKWFKLLLELMRDRAKLWGTDTPTEHRIAGSTQGPPIQVTNQVLDLGELTEMSDADLSRAIELAAKASATFTATASAAAVAAGAGAQDQGTPGDG